MTKEELRQHRRTIHALRLEIYQLENSNSVRRSRAMRVTTTITDEPRGGSIIHDTMAEMVAVIADKDGDIVRLSMLVEEIAKEVEAAIWDMTPRERMIFRCFYIECLTWGQVISLSNYSERQVFRIHGEALKKMAVKCS